MTCGTMDGLWCLNCLGYMRQLGTAIARREIIDSVPREMTHESQSVESIAHGLGLYEQGWTLYIAASEYKLPLIPVTMRSGNLICAFHL